MATRLHELIDGKAEGRTGTELRRRDRLELALQAAGLGGWEMELCTRAVECSSGFARLLGRTPETAPVSESGLMSCIHSKDRPAFQAALDEALRTGTGLCAEFRVVRPDGVVRWHSVTGGLYRDGQGGPERFAALAQDVTERKAAEARHQRLEAQMRQAQKLEAIGTLAGGIAHDFNNILGAMIGHAGLLRSEVENNPHASAHLDEIFRGYRRAKELVKQILAFSRQGGQERELVHLQAVIREGMQLLRAGVPSAVGFDVDLSESAGLVLANPTAVHQVVMNLVANAAHAMEGRAGSIRIRLTQVRMEGGIAGRGGELPPGAYVCFSVEDSGCGMSGPTLERIFDPFFTTKEPGKGTGLGLSVVHGIVHDHGGMIAVESIEGVGSVFRVYFPVVQEKPATLSCDSADQRGGVVVEHQLQH